MGLKNFPHPLFVFDRREVFFGISYRTGVGYVFFFAYPIFPFFSSLSFITPIV